MNNIKTLRKEKNCPIDKLSEATGISERMLYDLENGKRRLHEDQIYKLSEYFQCSIDDLLGVDATKYKNNIIKKNLKRLMNGRKKEFELEVNTLAKKQPSQGIIIEELEDYLKGWREISNRTLEIICEAYKLDEDYFYKENDLFDHLSEKAKKFISDKTNKDMIEKFIEMMELSKK
jgi:transcriptional regulator with XRE-family HTH domain